ncbi:hypothetical protein [Clostridioides difficile]|uniref:hypothetical protein n=1 Tax=Clostridioides difficile TaxID=1496 RepID=UPI0008249880|nr:hypothetical protein [Clostridioides difficile]MDB2858347.1 hypothetical protein [Clostridioides difficile]MDY6631031.1 hypothetical protein [Clostridioides difficile]HBG7257414.1 hypothetical protein [Clostridioides difficile]
MENENIKSIVEEVKEYLNVTWIEEDAKIEKMVVRGIDYFENEIAGIALDFKDSFNRELLFNYCRYVRNNAIEYFEENFSKELLRLQIKSAANEVI